MRLHLVTIGDELLLGKTANTHSAYIGQKLSGKGITVDQHSTIRDDREILETFLQHAINEADVVITTGGLGPTDDDNTKGVLARIFDRKIHRDSETLERLKKRIGRLSDIVKTQADVPDETVIIPNLVGSAPGFIFERESKTVIALPGPPRELKPMFEQHVIPYLLKLAGSELAYLSRTIRTIGMRECDVEKAIATPISKIETVVLGLCAHVFQVDVRLSISAESKTDGNSLLDQAEALVREKVGDCIYTNDDREIEEIIGEMLREQSLTVAVAESCTGGLIGSRITNISGSSEYFLGGMISYSNDWKTGILGVPEEIIVKHGAVSHETARSMAESIRKKSGASLGIASTGIAGPTGGTKEKPIGLVYVAISDEKKTEAYEYRFGNRDRELIKQLTSQVALTRLWQKLREPDL